MTCDVESKKYESTSIKTKQEVGPKELIEAQKAGFEFISGKDVNGDAGKKINYHRRSFDVVTVCSELVSYLFTSVPCFQGGWGRGSSMNQKQFWSGLFDG